MPEAGLGGGQLLVQLGSPLVDGGLEGCAAGGRRRLQGREAGPGGGQVRTGGFAARADLADAPAHSVHLSGQVVADLLFEPGESDFMIIKGGVHGTECSAEVRQNVGASQGSGKTQCVAIYVKMEKRI